jgi:hypothetical protein
MAGGILPIVGVVRPAIGTLSILGGWRYPESLRVGGFQVSSLGQVEPA